MRRPAFSIALIFVIALALVVVAGLEKSGSAKETAEELLEVVLVGCETAASAVSTSAGKVTVHQWYWRPSGEVLETDSVYTIVCGGDRLKIVKEVSYMENQVTPREPNPDFRPFGPGTVLRQQVAYDGEKVTSYDPAQRRAVIAGPDSAIGDELRSMKLAVYAPGHGVPDLDPGSSSPGHTMSGPYVVGREVVNGDECIVVEFVATRTDAHGDEMKHYKRTWINPQRGFTISKSEGSHRGGVFGEGVLLSQLEVDTRQYSDSLWGISAARHEVYALDDSGRRYLQLRTITTFAEDYKLNAPVTEEMLAIELPSGTAVYNELIDAEYTVP